MQRQESWEEKKGGSKTSRYSTKEPVAFSEENWFISRLSLDDSKKFLYQYDGKTERDTMEQ
jgi:hypothetical protein